MQTPITRYSHLLFLLILSAAAVLPSVGQGIRYDLPPILGPTGQPLSNIAVSLCLGTAAVTNGACAPLTQSFNTIAINVACPTSSPVTLTMSSTCQATSDAFGNAGLWLAPGAYIYCLSGRGIASTCYNLTIPVGSTTSGSLLVVDGSAATPSYSFTNATSTGFFHPGTSNMEFATGGTAQINLATSLTLRNTGAVAWANGDPFSVAADTGISRSATGVLAVGNGTQGDFSGTLKATTVNAVTGFQVNGVALAASNLSNGTTGSGSVVLATTPTIATPNISSPTTTGTDNGSETLVNKTLDTAAPNTFKINGAQISAVTGSGSVVLATSPTIITPSISSPTTAGTDNGTETLLNKTLDTAAPNTFKINGTQILAVTGSGSVVLGTSPTIATPSISSPTTTGTDNGTETLTNKTIGSGGLAGLTLNHQIFTSSGTFTIPTGVTVVEATVVGGGGAGGGTNGTTTTGAGGGAGAAAIRYLTGLTPGNTITVTVGTGGTGVSNAAGNNGGASSISSGTQSITTVGANGGGGGFSGTAPQSPGFGGSPTGGDLFFGGGAGAPAATAGIGGPGAGSIFGGQGSAALAGGGIGAAPGAGGGGAGTSVGIAVAGGNGAAGIVIFRWVN